MPSVRELCERKCSRGRRSRKSRSRTRRTRSRRTRRSRTRRSRTRRTRSRRTRRSRTRRSRTRRSRTRKSRTRRSRTRKSSKMNFLFTEKNLATLSKSELRDLAMLYVQDILASYDKASKLLPKTEKEKDILKIARSHTKVRKMTIRGETDKDILIDMIVKFHKVCPDLMKYIQQTFRGLDNRGIGDLRLLAWTVGNEYTLVHKIKSKKQLLTLLEQ
jgi:hypothetical protein